MISMRGGGGGERGADVKQTKLKTTQLTDTRYELIPSHLILISLYINYHV